MRLTTWLCRHIKFVNWSGRRDSDSRPSPWQGDTLPLSHFRIFIYYLPVQYFVSYINCTTKRFTQNEKHVLVLCLYLWATSAYLYDGAQRRNRTTDTGIFSPLLYLLSYLGSFSTFKSIQYRKHKVKS